VAVARPAMNDLFEPSLIWPRASRGRPTAEVDGKWVSDRHCSYPRLRHTSPAWKTGSFKGDEPSASGVALFGKCKCCSSWRSSLEPVHQELYLHRTTLYVLRQQYQPRTSEPQLAESFLQQLW